MMDPPPENSASNREALIEAKIAKIRAQNKALEKRHAEVERDKQQSGQGQQQQQQQQGKSRQHRGQDQDAAAAETPFRNPYSQQQQQRSQQQQQQQPRRSAQSRLSRGGGGGEAPPLLPLPGGGGGGPPPDPGYRFLADRMRDGSDPDLRNGGGGGAGFYDPDLDQDDRSSVHSSCSSYSQRGRRVRRRRRRSGSSHSNRGGPGAEHRRNSGYRGNHPTPPRGGRPRNPSGPQEPQRRPSSRDRTHFYDREGGHGDRGRGRGRGWDPSPRGGGGRGRGRGSFSSHDDWPEEDRPGGGGGPRNRNSSRGRDEGREKDLRRDANRDRPWPSEANPSDWEREGGPSHSRGGRHPSYRGGRSHWEDEGGKKGPRLDHGSYHRGRNDENRSPRQDHDAGSGRYPLRRPVGEEGSEDRVGNVLKEIRATGSTRPPPAPLSSAQARLERARHSPHTQTQPGKELGPLSKETAAPPPSLPKSGGLDWTCGDPGCGWANVSEADKCEKCRLTYRETMEFGAQKDTNRRVCSDRETLRVEVKFDRTLSPDQEAQKEELQPSAAPPTSTTNTSHFSQSQQQQQQLWQKPQQVVTDPNNWCDLQQQSHLNQTAAVLAAASTGGGQWQQQEPQEDDWRNAPPIGNWADEVDTTPDQSPQILNWDPHQAQYQQQQQPPASVYDTYAEAMAVTVGAVDCDYMQQQQQQIVYQQQQQQAAEAAVAVVQQQAQQYLIPFQQPAPQAYPIPSVPPTMTHLTHAGNPHGIMTPHQQPQAYIHPNPQPQQQQYYQEHHGRQGYNNGYENNYHSSHHGNTGSSYQGSSNRGSGHHYSSRGRGESYHYNNGGGSSYRSKIPPRFQKQRTSETPKTSQYGKSKYSSSNVHRHLPFLGGSLPKTAPQTCNRLTVFTNDSVIGILSGGKTEIEKTLKIPVQLVAVNGTKQLEQGLKKIDPSLDRFLLFHLLDDDALEISNKSKSDVNKGVDSDNAANELCDLIDTLAAKIPYIKIVLSKLLPRFDLEGEKTGMSVPNNVRKVMNVQLILRTHKYATADQEHGAKKVTILDNECLEWMDDEVKMLKVMKMNGRELTAFGESQLLETWTKVLKQCVTDEGLQLREKEQQESSSSSAKVSSLEVVEKSKVVRNISPSLRRPNPIVTKCETPPIAEPVEKKSEKPEDVPLPEDGAFSPSKESPVKPEEVTLPPSAPRTPELALEKSSESVVESSALAEVQETKEDPQTTKQEGDSKRLDVPAVAAERAAASSQEDEFHEAEDGGFIEDSYVSSSAAAASKDEEDESQLPSLGSFTIGDAALAKAATDDGGGGGQDDSGPASGIFIEDSYVDAAGTGLVEEFKEKENEEMMEKELSSSRLEEEDLGTTNTVVEGKEEVTKMEPSVKED